MSDFNFANPSGGYSSPQPQQQQQWNAQPPQSQQPGRLCKKCGTMNGPKAKTCQNCGANVQPITKKAWFIPVVIVGGFLFFAMIGAVTGSNSDSKADSSGSATSASTASVQSSASSSAASSQSAASEQSGDSSLGLGSTFEYDDMTVTIGDSYKTTTLDNEFSDKNGATVIELPITVTNNGKKSNSLNMFLMKQYGPKGVELDNISSYFMNEDDASWSGDLRPGATDTVTMHMLYDGDGTYAIEFEQVWGDPTVVEFDVQL